MKYINLIIVFNLIVLSFQAFSQDNNLNKIEIVRKKLLKDYNTISKLTDDQWQEYFINMSDQMKKKNENNLAETFSSMADPTLKEIILEQFKERIDHLSKNGIGTLIWHILVASNVISHDITVYYDDENDPRGYREVVISHSPSEAYPVLFWVVTILTLGDSTSASEI